MNGLPGRWRRAAARGAFIATIMRLRPRLAWPARRWPPLAARAMTSERVVSMAHCIQWGAASRARRSYIAR